MIEVPAILAILNTAADLALQHSHKVEPRWKDSKSYVTDADLAVQKLLVAWLQQHYPTDGLIAEEEHLRQPPTVGGRTWVIDPIDGTAAFASGLPVWGIGLALIEHGIAVAGFFAEPVSGTRFWALRGQGAFRNGTRLAVRAPGRMGRESNLLSHSRLHQAGMPARAYPGKVRSLGSTIAHLCYAAAGFCDAALLARVHIWDIAPGMLMLQESGGELRYLHGESVELDSLMDGSRAPRVMIGGHPETTQRFEAYLPLTR